MIRRLQLLLGVAVVLWTVGAPVWSADPWKKDKTKAEETKQADGEQKRKDADTTTGNAKAEKTKQTAEKQNGEEVTTTPTDGKTDQAKKSSEPQQEASKSSEQGEAKPSADAAKTGNAEDRPEGSDKTADPAAPTDKPGHSGEPVGTIRLLSTGSDPGGALPVPSAGPTQPSEQPARSETFEAPQQAASQAAESSLTSEEEEPARVELPVNQEAAINPAPSATAAAPPTPAAAGKAVEPASNKNVTAAAAPTPAAAGKAVEPAANKNAPARQVSGFETEPDPGSSDHEDAPRTTGASSVPGGSDVTPAVEGFDREELGSDSLTPSADPAGPPKRQAVEGWDDLPTSLAVPTVHARTLGENGPELVEARVRGRAKGFLEIRRVGDRLLLPVDELGGVLDIGIEHHSLATAAVTPLGRIEIPERALKVIDDQMYVEATYVENEMGSSVEFDEQSYSLNIEPLWRTSGYTAPNEPLEAEIDPPDASLAGIRATFNHLRYDELEESNGSLQLAGRLANGVWSVQAEESTEQPYHVQEYNWYTRRDKQHYLIGRQRVQLLPQLGDFDLVGAQYGWNNDQPSLTPVAYGANVLFPRRSQPNETIRGEAPAGYFVRLRIDGRVLDTQQVGYNGRYEFARIPLQGRQASEIEILIFDPNNLQIPTEIRRQRLAVSEYLMRRGAISHMAGVGLAGRFTQKFADTQDQLESGVGGYYQWRQGFTRNFTGEATIQHNGTSAQAYAGVVARVKETFVGSLGVIQSEEESGYVFSLEGFTKSWDMFARSTYTPGTFGIVATNLNVTDHRVEALRRVNDRLRVGFVARMRDDGIQDVAYALPMATWRPVPELYLDARPDLYGEYLVNAQWLADEETRVRYFRNRTSSLELTRQLTNRMQIGVLSEFENIDARTTLYASRSTLTGQGNLHMRAGVVHTARAWGYTGSISAPVLPWVLARAEYQSIPLVTVDGVQRGRFLLNLVTDLSQSGGRFVPARTHGFRREFGGIVGRVLIDPETRERTGLKRSDFSLKDAKIFIGDRGSATSDSSGRFFFGTLDPGVYEIELDPDQLPIELSPKRTRITARVAPGASTRVDFVLQVEFGIAGRVRDANDRPLAGAQIELVDDTGQVFARAWSDSFGLYRLDAVPPGDYFVQVRADGKVRAQRRIDLRDRFLFGQDVKVHTMEAPSSEMTRR